MNNKNRKELVDCCVKVYREYKDQLEHSSDANALNQEWYRFLDQVEPVSLELESVDSILCMSDVFKESTYAHQIQIGLL